MRRYSIESDAYSVAAAASAQEPDAILASSSPNNISQVVAGVQPANFAALNPLTRPNAARTASSRGKPAAPIATSTLPSIVRADFDEYTSEIASAWSKRPSAKGKGRETDEGLFRQRHPAASSSTSILLPPLDVVPEIFSDENFDLANPRTFDAVTRSNSVNGDAGPSIGDTAADQILQEKLSHYLDTVELHLTREISMRSASFFSALSNLQSLHSQSAQALERIASLKKELQAVDATTAQTGLAAVRAGLKRRRLESVTRGIDRIRELGRAVDQATQLANAGEWEGVLGLVEEVEGAIATPASNGAPDALGISLRPAEAGPSAPALQLHKLKALRGMPDRLARLRAQVARSLETEAITVLTNEFEDAVLAYRKTEGPTPSWDPKLKELARQRALDRIRPVVRGLLRCGWSALESIVASWKTALAKEIRQYVRADLPDEVLDADETLNDAPSLSTSRGASLSKTLAALSHEDFMALARKTMARLAAAIEVASVHSSVLLELIDEVAPAGSADYKASLSMELADVVHASGELANLRFSKIVAARNDEHAKLSLSDFVEVFNESWAFVVQCETACQRMIVGLRGVLVGQAKAFLQTFHQARVSESAKEVEVEQWTPADVPSRVQTIVEDIISGAVKDPKTFLLLQGSDADSHHDTNGAAAKHLLIEDRKYYAVLAALKALQSLAEYIRIVLNLPLLATDAMSRVIEFLKQFNSRTCQVVLGAGAMRSAGLKNITAKNLALASQSLSIMIALIPYVREALRRHLSTKQATMLTEFDKLKRDYQEHQYEIHAKFVSIMSDRLALHCKTLQGIDWTAADEPTPKKYMESLVKETATLHKVLVRFLPSTSVDQITGQVLKDIYAKLSEEYQKIVLHDVAAKARLLADAQYLRTEVAGFRGLSITLPGTLLEDLVQAKETTIAPPRPPTPPRAPTPSVSDPVVTESAETSPTTTKGRQENTNAPASIEIARSASSAAVRNRLAGLFGKRNSMGASPTSPVFEAPPRLSADSASSAEKEKNRGPVLADRLAALTGSPSRSSESLPTPSADTEAVEAILVAVPQDDAVQEAQQLAEHLAPDSLAVGDEAAPSNVEAAAAQSDAEQQMVPDISINSIDETASVPHTEAAALDQLEEPVEAVLLTQDDADLSSENIAISSTDAPEPAGTEASLEALPEETPDADADIESAPTAETAAKEAQASQADVSVD